MARPANYGAITPPKKHRRRRRHSAPALKPDENVSELQRLINGKMGESAGLGEYGEKKDGVDGKYGQNTHKALNNMLEAALKQEGLNDEQKEQIGKVQKVLEGLNDKIPAGKAIPNPGKLLSGLGEALGLGEKADPSAVVEAINKVVTVPKVEADPAVKGDPAAKAPASKPQAKDTPAPKGPPQ